MNSHSPENMAIIATKYGLGIFLSVAGAFGTFWFIRRTMDENAIREQRYQQILATTSEGYQSIIRNELVSLASMAKESTQLLSRHVEKQEKRHEEITDSLKRLYYRRGS